MLIRASKPLFAIAILVLVLLALVSAQTPDDSNGDTKKIQITIFKGEQDTLSRLKRFSPLFETYLQSLWPDRTSPQIPLDDAQFLGRIDFLNLLSDSNENSVAMLFGTTKSEQRILNDNGQRWNLYAQAFLSMLILDPLDFDADTYQLKLLQSGVLNGIDCLIFDVTPIKSKAPGRFTGTIWVETKNMKIVRVKGTFQPPKVRLISRFDPFRTTTAIYFDFDLWRERIEPDLWVPAYLVIDDFRPWKSLGGDGVTDIHYKSETFVWGYSDLGSFESRRTKHLLHEDTTDPLLIGLVADGLVAPKGKVEASLDAIVRDISQGNTLNSSAISCRILLTTNVELFHIGNTILVSRGLLQLVPSEEVLKGLLAHELAHVILDGKAPVNFDYSRSLFGSKRTRDFEGLGIRQTRKEEDKANALACNLLAGQQGEFDILEAARFTSQLLAMSSQVPHLAQARVGSGFVDGGNGSHLIGSCTPSQQREAEKAPFQLTGRYVVDASTGELRATQ